MSTSVTAEMDFKGEFFRVDPTATLYANYEKMMQGLAIQGLAAARAGLAYGAGQRDLIRVLDDRVVQHVIGRTKAMSGKQWKTAAVVQVWNKGLTRQGGTSLMAAGSEVEGETHIFRNIASQMRSASALLTANLTAGMDQ